MDVNTTACGFGSAPRYLTSLGGNNGHWGISGVNAIYLATATGFRVYLRNVDGPALTVSQAQSAGWQVRWVAVQGSDSLVRKYYEVGGQRVAMREGGQLRWLLADHLGSTAYTVSGVTELGEVRYRAFGKTRFSSGTTPTSYRYTGQREEAGLGLYYYGARWYDPALGHFIQPDTIVANAANGLDFHRYAYTRFNPLKNNDPTGHCGMLADIGSDAGETALTALSSELCMGFGGGGSLAGGAKAALSAAAGLGAAAALHAGLAAGSAPLDDQRPVANPPPLLETAPGESLQPGAITTSIPHVLLGCSKKISVRGFVRLA